MDPSNNLAKYAKFIHTIFESEKKVEKERLILAQTDSDFDFLGLFRIIDKSGQGYLTKQDVVEFLRENNFSTIEDNDIDLILLKGVNSLDIITYNDFLFQILPQTDQKLRERCIDKTRKINLDMIKDIDSTAIMKLVANVYNQEIQYYKQVQKFQLDLESMFELINPSTFGIPTYTSLEKFMKNQGYNITNEDFEALLRRLDKKKFNKQNKKPSTLSTTTTTAVAINETSRPQSNGLVDNIKSTISLALNNPSSMHSIEISKNQANLGILEVGRSKQPYSKLLYEVDTATSKLAKSIEIPNEEVNNQTPLGKDMLRNYETPLNEDSKIKARYVKPFNLAIHDVEQGNADNQPKIKDMLSTKNPIKPIDPNTVDICYNIYNPLRRALTPTGLQTENFNYSNFSNLSRENLLSHPMQIPDNLKVKEEDIKTQPLLNLQNTRGSSPYRNFTEPSDHLLDPSLLTKPYSRLLSESSFLINDQQSQQQQQQHQHQQQPMKDLKTNRYNIPYRDYRLGLNNNNNITGISESIPNYSISLGKYGPVYPNELDYNAKAYERSLPLYFKSTNERDFELGKGYESKYTSRYANKSTQDYPLISKEPNVSNLRESLYLVSPKILTKPLNGGFYNRHPLLREPLSTTLPNREPLIKLPLTGEYLKNDFSAKELLPKEPLSQNYFLRKDYLTIDPVAAPILHPNISSAQTSKYKSVIRDPLLSRPIATSRVPNELKGMDLASPKPLGLQRSIVQNVISPRYVSHNIGKSEYNIQNDLLHNVHLSTSSRPNMINPSLDKLEKSNNGYEYMKSLNGSYGYHGKSYVDLELKKSYDLRNNDFMQKLNGVAYESDQPKILINRDFDPDKQMKTVLNDVQLRLEKSELVGHPNNMNDIINNTNKQNEDKPYRFANDRFQILWNRNFDTDQNQSIS